MCDHVHFIVVAAAGVAVWVMTFVAFAIRPEGLWNIIS